VHAGTARDTAAWHSSNCCLTCSPHYPAHHTARPTLTTCSNEEAVALVQDTVKHPAMCAQVRQAAGSSHLI
jgi:hypothetical protein